MSSAFPSASPDWCLTRDPRSRSWECLIERLMQAVSLTAIVLLLLILVFVTREAMPLIVGATDNSQSGEVIPVEEMERLDEATLRKYLGLTPEQFRQMDTPTRRLLMEVKVEAALNNPPSRDAQLNTTAWRHLLLPHQWEGYSEPAFIWQPVSEAPKFNLIPLIIGSLKVTLVALFLGVPLAVGAALYVSQLAGHRARAWLKPAIELLAGVPSVVLGFFALMVMANLLQGLFGYASRLNAFLAGAALALAVIPLVFTLAEQALSSVPASQIHAALALGASRWRAAWQVALPAALPGVFAAVALGFSRALGETMIVLMASGNASILSWSLFDSTRAVTATIAAEMAETVFGGAHYRVLFLLGLGLLVVTFIFNLLANRVMTRLHARLRTLPA